MVCLKKENILRDHERRQSVKYLIIIFFLEVINLSIRSNIKWVKLSYLCIVSSILCSLRHLVVIISIVSLIIFITHIVVVHRRFNLNNICSCQSIIPPPNVSAYICCIISKGVFTPIVSSRLSPNYMFLSVITFRSVYCGVKKTIITWLYTSRLHFLQLLMIQI